MGEWSLQQAVFAVFVGTFSLAAAFCDFRKHKIPNWLTLPMFAVGWVYQISFFGWSGVLEGALAFGLGFGTLFVVWLMGTGGGGDVKLMGALSVWLGLRMTILVMVASTIIVFVGTIVLIAVGVFSRARKGTRDSTSRTPESASAASEADQPKRRMMAYAIPVALATWMLMVLELPRI